ncbi:MAG: Trk family potassium uptake protein [Oscillospiraceae bacterium]|nr:Trk family potassium uptake protein [Oscillospiraceae bacterium]
MKKKRFRLTPARLISLGFILVILAGTGLLMLPAASKGESAGFLDALFTATSATCVTGLVVRDTFTGWTTFGQAVILFLIQLGGLGFMTVITMISYALGKHLGLYNRKILMQSAGNTSLSGIGSLIRRIVPFTFLFELAGATALAIRFVPRFGWARGIWFSVFHSISAFCNAGFDLMGAESPYSSLTAFQTDPLVTLTISMLVIIGGLGFLVWRDLSQSKLHWSKYQLHTKLVVMTTGVLLIGGWLLFLLLESHASLEGLSFGDKLLASFFESVTPRTAGFNTVDLNSMSNGGNVLTNVLMLIGGSPGSTAGGIKTTTIAVLFLSTLASARGRTRVIACRYSIDRDLIRQACSIVCLYLLMAITAVVAICAFDPAMDVKQVMFEANSAIATVGLSLGITPALSAASHVVLILLMYAGRIGVLTFILVFSERSTEPPVDRPNGKLLIG